MFWHQGKTRTPAHNLKIASLLSCVAGMVNITSFLSIQRLTTNITGHFTFLIDEVFKLHFSAAMGLLFYILSFFAGSFLSSISAGYLSSRNERFIYAGPAAIECIFLMLIGLFASTATSHPEITTCLLLFSMGLQNSLVTMISDASVRTTHLTGLFTDMGIELGQLFYCSLEQRSKLFFSIRLRLTILFFFFLGGVAAGLLYNVLHLHTMLLAAAILMSGLIYDYIKFKVLKLTRHLRHH